MEFVYDFDTFRVSECGEFVKIRLSGHTEFTGWFVLAMFKPEIQALAKKAKKANNLTVDRVIN